MGCRVHVVNKHAEYAGWEAFNWNAPEFKSLLDTLGCCTTGEDYDDDFECDTDKYKKAIYLLALYRKYGKCEKVDKALDEVGTTTDDLDVDIEALEESIDDILEDMVAFLVRRDKSPDWTYIISFSAF